MTRPTVVSHPQLCALLQTYVGADLTREAPATEGFTQAIASTLTFSDGTTLFVKAAPAESSLAEAIHAAIELATLTPTCAPPLVHSADVDGWAFALWEALPFKSVDTWTSSDIPALADLATRMRFDLGNKAHVLPRVIPLTEALGPLMGTWRALAARTSATGHPAPDVRHLSGITPWENIPISLLSDLEADFTQSLRGDDIVHGDLRRDNILRAPSGKLYLVDWTHRWSAPLWSDLIGLGPDLISDGVDMQDVIEKSPFSQVDPHVINVFIASLAGYWFNASHRPGLAHAPELRPLQARQGKAAMKWLTIRL